MPYTTVEHESWFSRIARSLGGVLVGLVAFALSFPLLIWNEGRAVERAAVLHAGLAAVVEVSAQTVDPGQEGALVFVSGEAHSSETLRDPLIAQSVTALRLRRQVEMYQWVESSESETRKKLGGGTTTITTYTYDKRWSSTPIDSSGFAESGHNNPRMPAKSESFDARTVHVGARALSPGLIGQIDAFRPLAPHPALTLLPILDGRQASVVGDSYYFSRGAGMPAIGDLRMSLEVVDTPQRVSLMAAQRGAGFAMWQTPDGGRLEPRLELGQRSPDQMFERLHDENTRTTWALRFAGFMVMLSGLMLIFRPLVVVADVIPILGTLIEGGAGLLSLSIALPATLVTIGLGWLAYRPILASGLFVGAGLVFLVGIGRAYKR